MINDIIVIENMKKQFDSDRNTRTDLEQLCVGMVPVLTYNEINQFRNNGYLSIQSITSPEEITAIRQVYDQMFLQRIGWTNGDYFDFAGTDDPGEIAALPQILNPSRYASMLKNTYFRANAHAIAKQLLGESAELVFEHAMLKPVGIGGETSWHQDEAFYPKYTNYKSITIWMPLQAVDTSNGCLEFIPGSHKGPVLAHQSVNNDPRIHGLEAVGVNANQAVACPLPAGGATIHHCRTLHHAGPNRSNMPRRAYALGFGVRSRTSTLRAEFPWNAAKITARQKRANDSKTVFQLYLSHLQNAAKFILR